MILLLSLFLQGVTIPAPPRGFSPTEADMVVDRSGVIAPEARDRMNRLIFAVKSRSGGEIAVVTMPDLAGADVGDVALRIGREWKLGEGTAIGNRSRNAGVVVLVVPKETSSDGRGYISIQTGQGAEGFITDGNAGDIRREAIPYLQQQDYSSALELITTRVAQRYAGEFGFSLDSALLNPAFEDRFAGDGDVQGFPPQLALIIFIVLLLVFLSMSRASRRGCLYWALAEATRPRHRGGHWGGGGFGGGSWGGGGGGFGGFGGGGGFSGGGSSGSW